MPGIARYIFTFCLILPASGVHAAVLPDSLEIESKKSRKKLIVVVSRKKVSMLQVEPGFRLNPSYILGKMSLEATGVRFTPASTAPEGVPEKAFKKSWWYNPFFNEMFIPYSEIKKVKGGLLIIKKDGTRMKFLTSDHNEKKSEIRQRITI